MRATAAQSWACAAFKVHHSPCGWEGQVQRVFGALNLGTHVQAARGELGCGVRSVRRDALIKVQQRSLLLLDHATAADASSSAAGGGGPLTRPAVEERERWGEAANSTEERCWAAPPAKLQWCGWPEGSALLNCFYMHTRTAFSTAAVRLLTESSLRHLSVGRPDWTIFRRVLYGWESFAQKTSIRWSKEQAFIPILHLSAPGHIYFHPHVVLQLASHFLAHISSNVCFICHLATNTTTSNSFNKRDKWVDWISLKMWEA